MTVTSAQPSVIPANWWCRSWARAVISCISRLPCSNCRHSLRGAQNTKFLQPLARSSSTPAIMSKAMCQGTGERLAVPTCPRCSAARLGFPCLHDAGIACCCPGQIHREHLPACIQTQSCSPAHRPPPAHLTAALTGNGRRGR